MILGIDEVGRGCLAGPLVVGVVCLIKPIDGIKDSKLLTKAKRESLNSSIIKHATIVKLGWVWPEEIDEIGLTKSMLLAINRALDGVDTSIFKIIIDGNINYLKNLPNSVCLVKADQNVEAVSAASIIAKVARDNYMASISDKYPIYNFKSNVGYGTKEHIDALKKHGRSKIHRLSFKLREKSLNSL